MIALLNQAWWQLQRRAWTSFQAGLQEPETAQLHLLSRYLHDNAGTVFGRAHGFDRIRTLAEYRSRVPVRGHDEFKPYIQRVAAGEARVLTRAPVLRLEPSSGSACATKLIPYTRTLQAEFSRAIGPWVYELYRTHPWLLSGHAYWSISPVLQTARNSPSGLPIGFAEDTSYLAGVQKRLVDRTLAVPSAVSRLQETDVFRYVTLLALMRCRTLALVSVWHPSFLSLLQQALQRGFDTLREDIRNGTMSPPGPLDPSTRRALRSLSVADPQRAAELESPADVWRMLRVISCWADGPAAGPAAALGREFPRAEVQPKGLIATEAFISLPFGPVHPLAIRSHFFEFEDEAGDLHLAHELRSGGVYTLVLTTGGGLYRYALQDRVEVTDWLGRTPCFRFLGKADKVSDLCGEKLHEAFVCNAIQKMARQLGIESVFAMLAPDAGGYTCYMQAADVPAMAAAVLQAALEENYHYRYAVQLGQLRPVRIFPVACDAVAVFEAVCRGRGQRLGDIKPTALSLEDGWGKVFGRRSLEKLVGAR